MSHCNRRTLLQTASLVLPAIATIGARSVAHAAELKHARLNVTENPFGPSPAAKRAIAQSISQAAYYVEDEHALRDIIGKRENLPREKVALSNGSLDALSLLCTDIGLKGHIIAPQPGYSTHLSYAARRGVKTRFVPLKNHQVDLAAMKNAINAETALVYLCNPNNPTGQMIPHDQLTAFCREVAKSIPVIIDEAYFELLPAAMQQTMASLVQSDLDIIVTRTFSKVYGMAGLRIGYVLAQPARVRQLYSLTTTSRNQPGYAAAMACLGDEHYLAGAIEYLKTCRNMLYKICDENKLSYLESQGTFVYIDTERSASAVKEALAQRGVDIRTFDAPGYETWIRVGTATPDELKLFQKTLPAVLAAVSRSPKHG
ncbi:histidinol-phosphate aminotransferase family protein [Gluconobacter cerinus]|uniref:pyridoxal phosphate-dependent aminotransferase n=1 Tax=Gluconobacter TaxID=441 RepID=UPI001B8B44A4|nr:MULTISPECIES: histidinol-phosphate transaminase [Gluconobacter]MBS0994318.1 histidinol-phosphate aminotransferase family protein [Gluconobacter cerinus]MBS1022296.1 histidinol-phosphate aminotransferase family protein [Gluconobacter cerinus]